MTDALNSRGSFEALEASDASARNSRESIEVLHNVFVGGLDSRASYEALWQDPGIEGLDARLSIEVLQGPAVARERWGAIHA